MMLFENLTKQVEGVDSIFRFIDNVWKKMSKKAMQK